MAAFAEIDVGALRRYRRRLGVGNILSLQPLGLWRDALADLEIQPRHSLMGEDRNPIAPTCAFYADRQRKVIDELAIKGVI